MGSNLKTRQSFLLEPFQKAILEHVYMSFNLVLFSLEALNPFLGETFNSKTNV